MHHDNPTRLAVRMLTTAATATVAFLCGWSAGGWAPGVGLAIALGTAAGVAIFREPFGNRMSCRAWRSRRHTAAPSPEKR